MILRDNFNAIQTCFLDCISRSKKYPEIDLKTVNDFVFDVQTLYNMSTQGNLQFDAAQVQIAFMSSTRNDERTNRALNRGEFLDILVRLGHILWRKYVDLSFKNPSISIKRRESMSSRGRLNATIEQSKSSQSLDKDVTLESNPTKSKDDIQIIKDLTSSQRALAKQVGTPQPKSPSSAGTRQDKDPDDKESQADETNQLTLVEPQNTQENNEGKSTNVARPSLIGISPSKKKGEVHKHL